MNPFLTLAFAAVMFIPRATAWFALVAGIHYQMWWVVAAAILVLELT